MGWFEKVPIEEFDDDKTFLMTQLRATKWSSKIQFHRKLCSPSSVEDLFKNMKNNTLIWMNKKSFILLNKLPQSVPFDVNFRTATARVLFGDDNSIFIYGKTESVVADCPAKFLCLQDGRSKNVQLGTYYRKKKDPFTPTSFLTPEFMETFTKKNRNRKLELGQSCILSPEESIALASHHRPINLDIGCHFEDEGQAFVKALSLRTTHFGTLSLCNRTPKRFYGSSFPMISQVLSTVSQIDLITWSSVLTNEQLILPLTSPARRVEYDIWGRTYLSNKINPFNVVPRAVILTFGHCIPARFHTNFLQGSGNVRELGMIYSNHDPPSKTQQKELLKAIKKNQNLYQLELGCLDTLYAFWKKLLKVIGSHTSLRTVIFWVHGQNVPSRSDLHQLAALVWFMSEHIHLNILFKTDGWKTALYNKAETMVKPTRLQNRDRVLTRVPDHDRPAMLGAALTMWARGSVTETGVLLNENVDVLCSLVDQPLALPSDSEAPPARLNLRVNDTEGRVPKRRKRSHSSNP
ncbi:hypothetical protein FisN_2Hh183 [Fistulifera solaris]|jgi:hypothetical protein|uniref:Uncharacterized protein n=1 Tax=Fistulifera solaris TaxID=1519565 RepID=A0A1Z5KJM0_FISSO|nr:hypothetical protein FisN_2Hh183 [Fistulifera solaris]|eukprot:GAX26397.1 hypothetical protein FisN_2Hh183 [Fistulifera solaris]